MYRILKIKFTNSTKIQQRNTKQFDGEIIFIPKIVARNIEIKEIVIQIMGKNIFSGDYKKRSRCGTRCKNKYDETY